MFVAIQLKHFHTKIIIWQSYLLLPYKQKHVEIFGLEGGMVGL